MSSDADYETFLNKANEDSRANPTSTSAKPASVGIKGVDTDIPKILEVDEIYISESDEPFEPISLTYKKKDIPSAKELGKLVGGSVVEIGEKEFDPRGQYSKVIKAVKDAGNGRVILFKLEHDRTRSEYLVVSVDEGDTRLVGMKVLVIES